MRQIETIIYSFTPISISPTKMAVAKWLKKKRYKPTRTKGKERKETFWKLKAYGQVITDTALIKRS